MSILRNLLLASCLIAFSGATFAGCASTPKKAMAPAATSATSDEEMSDPALEDEDGDAMPAKEDDRRMGRDPCAVPIPE